MVCIKNSNIIDVVNYVYKNVALGNLHYDSINKTSEGKYLWLTFKKTLFDKQKINIEKITQNFKYVKRA